MTSMENRIQAMDDKIELTNKKIDDLASVILKLKAQLGSNEKNFPRDNDTPKVKFSCFDGTNARI